MGGRKGRLASREQVAEGTWAFQLEADGAFEYAAGQSVDVTLVDPPFRDDAGEKRAFSLAAAPDGPRLLIASRLRGSAFKRSLAEGPLGLRVEIEGPFGEMTLPESPAPVVMLAGGIGITPFRAIAQDAIARRLPHPLLLVHSSRAPGEAPFLAELSAWSAAHPAFRYVPTMTGAAPAGAAWTGERRRIEAGLLADLVPGDRNAPLWFLAGPDRFIQGVGAALLELGVAMGRMRMEQFSGY